MQQIQLAFVLCAFRYLFVCNNYNLLFVICAFRYLFVCNNYLSPSRGDGETRRVILESRTDASYGEYLYKQAGAIFHRHLIASVFRKPNFSQYTQVQVCGHKEH